MAEKRESNGLKKSCMPGRFLLAFVASLRFLVWMPSFFIVMGRSTCKEHNRHPVDKESSFGN